MSRQALTTAIDGYLAAATALERWSFDQLEVDVLRRDLLYARRRLTQRMDAIERSILVGEKATDSPPKAEGEPRECRPQCGRCDGTRVATPRVAVRDRGTRQGCRMMVAVDDSDPGRWAVRVAADLARQLKAELVLLHVINPAALLSPETAFDAEDVRGAQRRRADELLAAALALVDPATPTETLTLEGNAGDEIVTAAAEWEASFIVMGTRSKGRLAAFLLGSTAESVIRRAACPVLTVAHDPADKTAAARVAEHVS